MNTRTKLLSLAALTAMVCLFVGNAVADGDAFADEPAPAPVRTYAPRAFSCGGTDEIVVTAPGEWQVGESQVCVIRFRAANRYQTCQVVHPMANGLECVGTQPQATRSGNNIVWDLGSVERGEERTFQVQYRSINDVDLKLCAFLQTTSCSCSAAKTVRARIAIEKTGPETAVLGENVPYTITISNVGDGTAKNVVLNDYLPEGLRHSSGSSQLSQEIGSLAPGESRTLSLAATAVARGRHCNRAVVTTSNAGTAESTACTVVQERQLQLTKDGTPSQFLGRKANYNIVVTNPGDAGLTDVVVVDTLPPHTTYVSSSGGQVQGNQVIWRLNTLGPGQSQTFNVTVTCHTPGTHVNTVTAECREGLRRQAEAPTVWRGMPAVRVEVVDDPDPVEIGGETVYTISVMNQGTAQDSNVEVTAVFPNSLKPLAVSGAIGSQIQGQKVIFAPVPTIQPKQEIIYRIKAQALSVDDARLRVYVKTNLLETPVCEEESTHLY
ncbi:DUF11 domain-containing protein [bacterium]|nr:DUF11 domain-containing protein [bacterium]